MFETVVSMIIKRLLPKLSLFYVSLIINRV